MKEGKRVRGNGRGDDEREREISEYKMRSYWESYREPRVGTNPSSICVTEGWNFSCTDLLMADAPAAIIHVGTLETEENL